jgi:hypothetical protein
MNIEDNVTEPPSITLNESVTRRPLRHLLKAVIDRRNSTVSLVLYDFALFLMGHPFWLGGEELITHSGSRYQRTEHNGANQILSLRINSLAFAAIVGVVITLFPHLGQADCPPSI